LFGVIGNFLILEKINRWNPKTKEEIDAYYLAHEQMGTVFQTLAASREIEKPQVNDFIPAGIYKGKVVFYTVYDYL
jgi:hypothetical protein